MLEGGLVSTGEPAPGSAGGAVPAATAALPPGGSVGARGTRTGTGTSGDADARGGSDRPRGTRTSLTVDVRESRG